MLRRQEANWSTTIPDFSDPVTVLCLLQLVRQASPGWYVSVEREYREGWAGDLGDAVPWIGYSVCWYTLKDHEIKSGTGVHPHEVEALLYALKLVSKDSFVGEKGLRSSRLYDPTAVLLGVKP